MKIERGRVREDDALFKPMAPLVWGVPPEKEKEVAKRIDLSRLSELNAAFQSPRASHRSTSQRSSVSSRMSASRRSTNSFARSSLRRPSAQTATNSSTKVPMTMLSRFQAQNGNFMRSRSVQEELESVQRNVTVGLAAPENSLGVHNFRNLAALGLKQEDVQQLHSACVSSSSLLHVGFYTDLLRVFAIEDELRRISGLGLWVTCFDDWAQLAKFPQFTAIVAEVDEFAQAEQVFASQPRKPNIAAILLFRRGKDSGSGLGFALPAQSALLESFDAVCETLRSLGCNQRFYAASHSWQRGFFMHQEDFSGKFCLCPEHLPRVETIDYANLRVLVDTHPLPVCSPLLLLEMLEKWNTFTAADWRQMLCGEMDKHSIALSVLNFIVASQSQRLAACFRSLLRPALDSFLAVEDARRAIGRTFYVCMRMPGEWVHLWEEQLSGTRYHFFREFLVARAQQADPTALQGEVVLEITVEEDLDYAAKMLNAGKVQFSGPAVTAEGALFPPFYPFRLAGVTHSGGVKRLRVSVPHLFSLSDDGLQLICADYADIARPAGSQPSELPFPRDHPSLYYEVCLTQTMQDNLIRRERHELSLSAYRANYSLINGARDARTQELEQRGQLRSFDSPFHFVSLLGPRDAAAPFTTFWLSVEKRLTEEKTADALYNLRLALVGPGRPALLLRYCLEEQRFATDLPFFEQIFAAGSTAEKVYLSFLGTEVSHGAALQLAVRLVLMATARSHAKYLRVNLTANSCLVSLLNGLLGDAQRWRDLERVSLVLRRCRLGPGDFAALARLTALRIVLALHLDLRGNSQSPENWAELLPLSRSSHLRMLEVTVEASEEETCSAEFQHGFANSSVQLVVDCHPPA